MNDIHALSLFFAYMIAALIILGMTAAILQDRRKLKLALLRVEKKPPQEPILRD